MKGTGLATAFAFVQEQDGAIDARSSPGEGSAFDVWLPAIPQAGRGDPAAGGTVMVAGRTHTSVQEDKETLATLGYEPVCCANPEVALAALHDEQGRFDLLIVESHLSGLPGLAFASRAARISGRPIVLSLSGSEAVRPEELSAIPVVDAIRRPWNSSALALTLQRNLVVRPGPESARLP